MCARLHTPGKGDGHNTMPMHRKRNRTIRTIRTIRTADGPAAFSVYDRLLAAVTMAQTAPLRCIMVTSAGANEGTATAAAGLATSLADAGLRVVLVDCDLRHGMMQECLPVNDPVQTLASLLEGDGPVNPTPVRKNAVHILPAGIPEKNPAVLLGSERMAQVLDRLRRTDACVVCAAPPVCLVPDAELLGRRCDGTLLAVRHRFTHRRAVSEAVQRLERAGVPIMGTVLTDFDLTLERMLGRPYVYYGRK